MLKNSLIFFLYNKNLKNNSNYIKVNNSIKGFDKDPILNDYVYFASNGIKKNAIFRKIEFNDINKNFVSYFRTIEDQFSVFNLYPQKYNSDLIKNYTKKQEIIFNWISKNKEEININSYFLINSKLLNKQKEKPLHLKSTYQILIKNYYNNYLLLNNKGFINQINNKLFQKNLFSGLMFVLPFKIQKYIKETFSINYLLLNFYSNINIKSMTKKTLILNLIIYSYYLKFINTEIKTFFDLNKIKIRKSNWLLYKYSKVYLRPINNVLNLLYNINLYKNVKFSNLNIFLNQFYYNNLYNKKNSTNKISFLTIDEKIKALKILIQFFFYNTTCQYSNYKTTDNILVKYLLLKSNLYNYIILNKFTNIYLFNNFNYINNNINLLNRQITNIYLNSYLEDKYLVHTDSLLKYEISNKTNTYSLNREFLNYKEPRPFVSFDKDLKLNKYRIISKQDIILDLQKRVNRLKRSLYKQKRNFKKDYKIQNLFTERFKNLKLKRTRSSLLKFYNLVNEKK